MYWIDRRSRLATASAEGHLKRSRQTGRTRLPEPAARTEVRTESRADATSPPCPAMRSTQVSHARAGETRSRAQTEDSMGDRGHALGHRAVRWSLRGHGCRPSRVIASYPSEVSRRSMNARGVRISTSPMFASRRSRSPDRTPGSTTARITRRRGAPAAAPEVRRRQAATPLPQTGCSRPAPHRAPSYRGIRQAPPRRSRRHPSPARRQRDHAAARRDPHLAGRSRSTVDGHTENVSAPSPDQRLADAAPMPVHNTDCKTARRSRNAAATTPGRSGAPMPHAHRRPSLGRDWAGRPPRPPPLTPTKPAFTGHSSRPSPSLLNVSQVEAIDSELRAAAPQLQGFHR
jgi:hypothetical protein